MDRFEKIQNIAGAVLFGAIGITALTGATFFGATHQFAIAALCAMMVWAFIAEIRREGKRAKAKNDTTL
ncbi:MAG: hypothetical protein LBU80_06020 [Rikenellaceae bacterium]|jgi:hypothetical protein|nr:hypothetical protein [Rikenellaceae bacterium]